MGAQKSAEGDKGRRSDPRPEQGGPMPWSRLAKEAQTWD